MYGLPKSTEFNKKVPKNSFYEKLDVSNKIREKFISDIQDIVWSHKIAENTINVPKGIEVTEIEVFKINLKLKNYSEDIINLIDKKISYHIIFIISYENNAKVRLSYKKQNTKGEFSIEKTFETEWMPEYEIEIRISGLDLDKVYENIIREIGSKELSQTKTADLETEIKNLEEREKLIKKIETLTKKKNREKQVDRKLELRTEIKKLEKELEKLQ